MEIKKPRKFKIIRKTIYYQATIKTQLFSNIYRNRFWCKKNYDISGKPIYYEDSKGYWERYEYDDNGNQIYYEDSDGIITDRR